MATEQEIIEFIKAEFPQAKSVIEDVGKGFSKVRRKIGDADLRPGGTVSGPTMMAVADFALYVALLGEIGIVPLAVTTNLNMNFLRKPLPERDLIGECKLLKVGKSLAVGEVSIYSAGSDEPVAHAVGTYAIPPKR